MPNGKVTQAEQARAFRVIKLLGEFNKIDNKISLQLVLTFYAIATHEGANIREIAEWLGFEQATTSRNVGALGAIDRRHNSGYGFVQSAEDPLERRRKVVTLTPKGHKFLRDCLDHLQEG